jgi:hypothetical protein
MGRKSKLNDETSRDFCKAEVGCYEVLEPDPVLAAYNDEDAAVMRAVIEGEELPPIVPMNEAERADCLRAYNERDAKLMAAIAACDTEAEHRELLECYHDDNPYERGGR